MSKSLTSIFEGQHIDHFSLITEERRKKLVSLVSVGNSKIFQLPYKVYVDYANNPNRSVEALNLLFLQQIPNLRQVSQVRRFHLIESFNEVEYEPDNVLEIEGSNAQNLYLLLNGEVTFYKRPEGLYNLEQKRIKIDRIDNIQNPKDSGADALGLPMGTL